MRQSFTAVIDDDPTGIQTVHGVNVYMDYSADMLERAAAEDALFFIQTNSRGRVEKSAAEINALIMERLVAIAARQGGDFTVISRSDSTLRGHYPAETEALRETYERLTGGRIDGELLVPFFPEGGRITMGDVHYVREGEALVPAGSTEFARDSVFGYRSSDLRQYVEEKTRGRVRAQDVLSISLEDLRGDAQAAYEKLMRLSGFQKAVVNAETYDDLDALVRALRRAEREGRKFLYRTASSFVRSYASISPRPLLSAADLPGAGSGRPGFVVAGSHVKKTTGQLERLLSLSAARPVEVRVDALLAGEEEAAAEISRCSQAADAALSQGRMPVIYTSRALVTAGSGGTEENLDISAKVSCGVVAVVRSIRQSPAFVVAKGGITSSDVAVKALGIKKAAVLGQIRPGVPVLLCGPESRWPGIPYVVFPGNVGGADDLLLSAETLMKTV